MAPITAQEEFSRHDRLKKENIEYLREWLTKQPHLPGSAITDEQLILFLHSCQHSLEGCKQSIESYYTIRTHAPELFGGRDPERPELKEALDITELVVMPKRDPRGHVIMVARLTEENAGRFNFDDTLNVWFMLQDTVLRELGAVPGFVFVFDMKGCAIGHVARIKLSTVKKYFMYIQDGFPGVVINNHIVNVNSATETFLSMCRQFMRKELLSKLQVHTSWDTLYEFLPRAVLPKEYGGDLDSLTEYYKSALESLHNNREWFREIEEATKVDESKRPGKAKNAADIFGVEGSFKKLDID